MCLGGCGQLLSAWVGPDSGHGNRESLKQFFLRSLITRALSEVTDDNISGTVH